MATAVDDEQVAKARYDARRAAHKEAASFLSNYQIEGVTLFGGNPDDIRELQESIIGLCSMMAAACRDADNSYDTPEETFLGMRGNTHARVFSAVGQLAALTHFFVGAQGK
ncbi:hypothetical protein [uncultured Sphingomonas sp.]|uniref:hypothetical protein n=1 Tax=uncultured Sphingomonas sp. TaxID=158754 RepID=UPI0025DB45DE|nr:hypothetical protein [uncultured Sphingomonas sp.]